MPISDERMKIAKETGFEFVAEELSDARSPLFDEELDAVSGGGVRLRFYL
ncbi:MAG: Nif11-like leader peptide family natural product precursor [Chlorobiaceae bacterium]|nr:Nif11-like leader peptide family natural product precursor [Chlorobiaceae bacterium]